MVLTRSRTNSAERQENEGPVPSNTRARTGHAAPRAALGQPPPTQAVRRPSASGSSADEMDRTLYSSPPPQMDDETAPQPPAHGSQPTTAAPIIMSDQQLVTLIHNIRALPPAQGATPSPGTVSNLSNCSSRYDGTGDVIAFIDAISIYKDCLGVPNPIALRGLPMLLSGFAATWWQGVKQSVLTWEDALSLLQQTFGPRLPPHRIYRELFSREQADEQTDVFVCRARALLAQLPAHTLPENPVQLDMVYGLLNRRIREKVARISFSSFSQLLQQARVVEDLLDEGRMLTPSKKMVAQSVNPPLATDSSHELLAPSHILTAARPSSVTKPRPKCGYCKIYGHSKDDCRKLTTRKTSMDFDKPEPAAVSPEPRPSITCFGCGTPGVMRSHCSTCKERRSTTTVDASTAFHSVNVTLLPRVRPIFELEVFGARGTALLDTGAKQSVASVSLVKILQNNGQHFNSIDTELKFADGTKRIQTVDTCLVDVRVQGVVVSTLFIVLPNATDTLLGMNFIKDAGLMLDFKNNRYSLHGVLGFHKMKFEQNNHILASSSMSLRQCEGTLLEPEQKERLIEVLEQNADVFTPGGGPTPYAIHRIDTGNATPVFTPPYRVTPAKKELIRSEIDKMLEQQIIEEAESEWMSPVVLVPKKNGEMRFCVDYRKLNAVTRTDRYPLPLIDELISSTKANCVMSSIDLKAGYWQINLAPEDRPKTAFATPFGTFQFLRMPFGLKNSPATFQRLMDRFRMGLKDIVVVAYLDDILVISDDFESHLCDLDRVFSRLRDFNLQANREKCVFARERITYLGHVISAHGIEPDPMKVEAVMKMEPPTNIKELRTFLQTCAWFRKFIPSFSEVARPLTDLTKKNRPWKWGEEEIHAFEMLKTRLSTSPILQQPDYEQPFILRTDASAYALGAVLMQGLDPQSERPIEYASRLLTSAEQNYTTTEREGLAVVWSLDKFRGYLEGAQIRVATDHQPLRWLFSLKTANGRLARWALKIQAYNLVVDYTPGKVNVVADTLSRPVLGHTNIEEQVSCDVCPVSIDLPRRSSEDLRTAQLDDPEIKKIITDFEDESAQRWIDRGYYLAQGVLFRFNPDSVSEEPQLVVPMSMREEIMKELHDAPTAGHLGLERTLKRVKERYYFPNMRYYVSNYLKACDLCQKFKPSNLKPAGLLQTPVPQQRFEVLAMDLFGPLPAGEKGERWIFLVEDTASRWVELFPLVDATAEICAKVLLEEIFLRYGFPRRIISDNGVQFISAVMQKALYVVGTTQNLTPIYHPEANPAERKNRDMKQMLSILIDPEHRRWPETLPAVRFALNTAFNQGTGHSAAYLTFAREFRSPVNVSLDLRTVIDQENYVPQITPYLRDFAQYLKEVNWRIEHQQDIRKDEADKSRRPNPGYREGDLVLVESHRLSHAKRGFTSKFAPRREGPYRVAKVLSNTTFLVCDKEGRPLGKHHASLLTPYVGDATVVAHPRKRGRPRKH